MIPEVLQSSVNNALGKMSDKLPHRESPITFSSVHFSLGNRIPAKVELPVESTVSHIRACHVLKSVIADYINDRTYHCSPNITKANFKTFQNVLAYCNNYVKIHSIMLKTMVKNLPCPHQISVIVTC